MYVLHYQDETIFKSMESLETSSMLWIWERFLQVNPWNDITHNEFSSSSNSQNEASDLSVFYKLNNKQNQYIYQNFFVNNIQDLPCQLLIFSCSPVVYFKV